MGRGKGAEKEKFSLTRWKEAALATVLHDGCARAHREGGVRGTLVAAEGKMVLVFSL